MDSSKAILLKTVSVNININAVSIRLLLDGNGRDHLCYNF